MNPKEWAEQYATGRRDAEKYLRAYGTRIKYTEIYGPYHQGYNDAMGAKRPC